jgi:hypothetical protein
MLSEMPDIYRFGQNFAFLWGLQRSRYKKALAVADSYSI